MIHLVEGDLMMIDVPFDEEMIATMSTSKWKKFVKTKVGEAAFDYFKSMQVEHSKVRDITYNKFETQSYLKSKLFSDEECQLLFRLRCKTLNFKCNMSSQYSDLSCALKCHDTQAFDDQEHLLSCSALENVRYVTNAINKNIQYSDMFSIVTKQKNLVVTYAMLLQERNRILEDTCKSTNANARDPLLCSGEGSFCSNVIGSLHSR